jgi:hypothetical protein
LHNGVKLTGPLSHSAYKIRLLGKKLELIAGVVPPVQEA